MTANQSTSDHCHRVRGPLSASQIFKHAVKNGLRLDRYATWLVRCAEVESYLKLQRPIFESDVKRLGSLHGPAIVAGSAPNPTRPNGIDNSWARISVNSSQLVLEHLGLQEPHITIFQPRIRWDDEYRQAYWRVMAGRNTGHLICLGRRNTLDVMAPFLLARKYTPGKISVCTRRLKDSIVADIVGRIALTPFEGLRSISNGLFGAFLAAKLGANPVVMVGFSIDDGWFHTQDVVAKRNHVALDIFACQNAIRRGAPFYTTEPAFASATGVPLWPQR
jgi:hypothetical protein